MPAIHKDNVIAREQAETKQHMTTNVLSQTLWTRQLSFIILQFCSPFIQISRRLFRRTDAVCNLYDSESAARNAMAAEEIFIDCNSVVRVVFRFGFANTTLNKEIDFLRDLPPLTDVILCVVCCTSYVSLLRVFGTSAWRHRNSLCYRLYVDSDFNFRFQMEPIAAI